MTAVPLHAFVDESKRGAYVLAVALVPVAELSGVRSAMRGLLLPGQRRVHFKNEQDGRRHDLLRRMQRMDIRAHVLVARTGSDPERRRACLSAAIEGLCELNVQRLMIELAEGDLAADRQTLFQATRKLSDGISYHHVPARDDPCLWLADGLAWAYSHGGRWREQTEGMVRQVREV